MKNPSRRVLISAAAAAALAGGLVVAPVAADAAAKSIPVVTVHAGKTLTLSRTHLAPGRVTFDVHSAKGEADVQLLRLRGSYTIAQGNKDAGLAFSGNAAAVRRLNSGVDWKGGLGVTAKHPRSFTVHLSVGTYYVNENNIFKKVVVSGTEVARKSISTNSAVSMLTYGFDSLPTLPRSGVMRLTNGADQPHFLELIHVKKGTTRAQLIKAFQGNTNAPPSFVLSGGASSGTLSPTRTQAFTYSVPAGTYVMACFWPDDRTGMPHAAMGMFKLVTLS